MTFTSKLRLLPILITVFGSNFVYGSIGVYSLTKGFSEPVPLQQMFEGWRQTGIGTKAQGRQRLGVIWVLDKQFVNAYFSAMGIEKRWDYHLRFSKDTARFYSLLERQGLSEGRYPLRLSVNAVEANALFFQNQLVSPWGILTTRLNLLDGLAVQAGQLKGVGEVLGDGQYSFEYDLDYQFSENKLLDARVNGASGNGYSLDVAFERPVFKSVVTLGASDLFYRMHWKAIGKSDGCLFRNRAQLEVCDRNYVQDSKSEFVQMLPAELYASVDTSLGSIRGELWDNEKYLTASYYIKPSLSLGYEFYHQGIQLAFKQNDMSSVSLMMDHYDASEARLVSLNAQYSW